MIQKAVGNADGFVYALFMMGNQMDARVLFMHELDGVTACENDHFDRIGRESIRFYEQAFVERSAS